MRLLRYSLVGSRLDQTAQALNLAVFALHFLCVRVWLPRDGLWMESSILVSVSEGSY